MKRIVAITVLCLSAACGPALKPGEQDENTTRLCVENATAGYGNIVARAGLVRFNVMPGQEQCRSVIVTGASLDLRAVTTGGGSGGPISYSERLQTGASRCWRWRLSNSRASAADLTPCDR